MDEDLREEVDGPLAWAAGVCQVELNWSLVFPPTLQGQS